MLSSLQCCCTLNVLTCIQRFGSLLGDTVNQQEFRATLSMLLKPGEKTYTQRCRLFIGNLPNDITDEDFRRLFAKYGEPSEVFINKGKGFGFIRLVSCFLLYIQRSLCVYCMAPVNHQYSVQ